VIPEKTVYMPGETARVMVTVPFTGAQILLTLEKGGIISREVFTLSGNTFTREYKVDDTLIPNAYVWVVALSTTSTGTSRSYAVGYGEIISDYTEKKWNLTLTPDKETYKNREAVSVDLTLTDRSGNPLQWEVAMMVVDESLIRLLGNIDLDILPKFYQKYPFTMKTSLSAIGIERNRWLSRKWSNGWSGDKWGGGVEIASRSLFQNTAYYNPSIRTDASGKAKIQFTLPDNVTDYRIITIANTKDAHFAVSEKTIQVRKDYVIEALAPMIIRPGDTSRITASVFNSTKNITAATLTATIGTGAQVVKKTVDVTLNPGESLSRDFDFSAQNNWSGSVPYRIDLKSKDITLDSYTSTFRFAPIPEIESTSREVLLFTGSEFRYTLPESASGIDLAASKVSVSISTSYATQLSEAIRALVQYPYGCIEQTIGSTLPNAYALKLASTLGITIDTESAKANVTAWLAKILRMQHYSGGWTYWEGDSEAESHITPYVLRSLITFRNLGYDIPDAVLENGANYVINNLSTYREQEDILAEAVWTLAQLGRTPEALEAWKNIDTKKLTRHGYIAYGYTAHILKTYTPEMTIELDKRVFSTGSDTDYWYWDTQADTAIYAQLLLDRGEEVKALPLIDSIVRSSDMTSYFMSTQAKLQTFRALIKQSERSSATLTKNLTMAFRWDALIADATLTRTKSTITIDSTREKIGRSFTLKRDDPKTPLYITITTRDRTKSIVDMPAKNANGMMMFRTFERVDESKWVDADGDFIGLAPVTDGIFKKWELYRVTLKTIIPGVGAYGSWYNLTVEDYYPAGWRPINSRLKTESALTRSESIGSWSYNESRDDRMLAHIDYGYSSTRTYTYYIRPNIVGSYLLPPAMSYYMYRPEVHAYTKYEKVQVKE
jgi:alpha-2-macroglobulin